MCKGVDAEGRLEGWVGSEFNALVLGFGETGREVLGFLYEYGAFVDKDFNKSVFSCVVMDSKMDHFEHAYVKSFPGMNRDAGIVYRQCEVGSNAYWKELDEIIDRLNYVVVCMGNDRQNLCTAVNLLEYAYRRGKDLANNFVILVAQQSPTLLDEETLKHYNSISQYHNCIRTFGNSSEVWTYDNITNESMTVRAMKYFCGYRKSQGSTGDAQDEWRKREEEMSKTADFALYAKRVRQRSQDYANCMHISTKFALMGPEIIEHRKEIARCIPPVYTYSHYTGDDPHVERTLRYMAVLEHVRWEASHVARLLVLLQRMKDQVLTTSVIDSRVSTLSRLIA